MSNAMCNFKEGQYIIYQNGDSFEIGKMPQRKEGEAVETEQAA